MLLTAALPASVHHSADAAYTLAGDAGHYALSLTAGTWSFDADMSAAGTDWQNLSLQLGAGTTVAFNSPQTLGGLQLSATAKATVSQGSGGANGNLLAIGATGLSIDPTATLDLTDNDMILQNAGSAAVAQLQALLQSGYDAGDWHGPGLTSSAAAASATSAVRFALGFALNGSLPSPFTTFDGIAVSDNDLLVKYTFNGDMNLDGAVNLTDYRRFTVNYLLDGTTWTTGDFNYDGSTNLTDYRLFQRDYLQDLSDPNYARTVQPTGQTLMPIEGQQYFGNVSTFTDANTPTTAADYIASIAWGDGNFLPATVAADPAGGFDISGRSPCSLTDPDALIVALVQYAPTSVFAGRPASLSEPIQITPAVSKLSASAISSGEIDLAWTLNANNASGIEIDRSTDGVIFSPLPTTAPGHATSYQDTDPALAENTTYWYQVRAIQPGGSSIFSNVVSAMTLAAVSDLAASAISTTEIDLSWTNAAAHATAIQVQRSSDGVVFTPITPNLPAGATTFADTGLTEGTHYYYQVCAVNGSSSTSTSAFTNLADTYTIPIAPTGLTAEALFGEVALTWMNNSASSPAYAIERSLDGVTFTPYDTTAPGADQYVDSAPYDGTSIYRVEALNGDSSAQSTSITATAVAPILSPTSLVAQAVSNSEIDLRWTNNSQVADGIRVLRSDDNLTYSTLVTLGHTTTSTYSDTGLPAGKHYFYKVEAMQGSNPSVPSYGADDTTVPPTPTGLGVAMGPAIGRHAADLDLTWDATPGALGYDIQRRSGGGPWQDVQVITPGSTTAYSDGGLDDGVSYEYRIDAFNNAGTSDLTDAVSNTTAQTFPTGPTAQVVGIAPAWCNWSGSTPRIMKPASSSSDATAATSAPLDHDCHRGRGRRHLRRWRLGPRPRP